MKKKLSTFRTSALVGIEEARKDQIRNPHPIKCQGCGETVYISKECLQPAKDAVISRGYKLVMACRSCAAPFLDCVARGDGDLEMTQNMDTNSVIDELKTRRRRFVEGN